jgi:hypothetical protein
LLYADVDVCAPDNEQSGSTNEAVAAFVRYKNA